MAEVMLIVPHPDDEVFSCGGLFTKMAVHGRCAVTVTLTRGGSGRNLGVCHPDELGSVRERELKASLDVLGVRHSHLFDFPDGELKRLPEAELVEAIVPLIEQYRPRAVVTFPPNGSNGHPDHVATNRAASRALREADHEAEAVYYFAADRPVRIDARPGWLSPEEVYTGFLPATHYLDVQPYIENKIRAMGQHETQARSVLMFMRRFPRRLMHEAFHRAHPPYPEDVGPVTVEWL